jgi:hypothetical protein
MRVDGLPNIQAAIRTNVADLMSRLEAGDVIKAKVLEITSDEVLLRLFDGSLLKAAAGEDLVAKAGQTLTLTVTAKSEGTLYLETLKDQSRMDAIKPDLLKNLLASLNLKANSKNLELAAEFIKAGISPTEGQFDKASTIMKDYSGLNAEKAVFMASKGIQADQAKLELLSKLLDGDLKLGEQLKELQVTLNNVRRATANTASGNTAANAVLDAATTTTALAEKAALTKINTASQQLQTTSAAKNTETSTLNPLANSADTAEGTAQSAASKITSATQTANLGLNTSQASAAQKSTEAQTQSTPIITPESSISVQEQIKNNRNSDPGRMGEQLTQSTNNPGTTPGNRTPEDAAAMNRSTAAASEELVNTSDKLSRNLADDTASSMNKSDSAASDPLLKIRDTIKELFVRLESGKLTGEIDLRKIHKELYDKLDTLRTNIHNSGISGLSGGEGVTAAVNLLDDSVKLLNQLNNSSVLYYQMPVNLSGQNTTAEMYIMKRQQSKKRIDPHNSVMFVSLDTNNLGRFETLIDVKGNNVTMNFRTEKQEINDFIKENIKYLYKGLSESGYKLADIRYALIDSATPPLKLEQLLSKMMESNHSKLDMRV